MKTKLRRLHINILVLAISLLLGSFAYSKMSVNYDASFRNRYKLLSNPTSIKDANDGQSFIESRGILGVNLQDGETLLVKSSLLYQSRFGQTATPSLSSDGIDVNEFYGWWKTSDTLSIWFGRFNLELGDGKAFSKNDYEQSPYSFDGARFGFLTDFAEFDIYFIKLSELSANNTLGTTTIVGVTENDPETQLYILNVEFKSLAEILDRANFHFAQVVKEESQNQATPLPTIPKQNFQHLSVNLEASYSVVYWQFNFSRQYGQRKGKDSLGDAFSQNFNGQMVDTTLGVRLPDFYKFKAWASYHSDTGGEDDASKDQGVDTYQSLFYNLHDNAGRADIFRWGNLTYYSVGLEMTFLEAAEFGLEALVFERSNVSGNVNLSSLYNIANGSLLSANEKALGAEIDFWYHQSFDNGLLAALRVSVFQPGDAFKNAATPAEELSYQVQASLRFNLK